MYKWLYWLLPLGWMGVIFYSSSQPYQEQDIKPFLSEIVDLSFLTPYVTWINFTYHNSPVSVKTHGVNGLLEFFVRKGAHVTVFFILTLLIYLALSKTIRAKINILLLISFVATFIYAAVDEIHQGFTPNRTPYIGDVILDTIGAMIAILMVVFIKKGRAMNN